MPQTSKAVKLSDLQQGRGEIENFVQHKDKPSLRLVAEMVPRGFETLEEAQEAVRMIESQGTAQVTQVSEIAKDEPKAEPMVRESETTAVADLHRMAESAEERVGEMSYGSNGLTLEQMQERHEKLVKKLADLKSVGDSRDTRTIQDLDASVAQLKSGILNEQDRLKRETRDLKKTSERKSIEEIFESDAKGYVPLESLRHAQTESAPLPKKMHVEPEEDLTLPSGVIRSAGGWRATPSEQRPRSAPVSISELPVIEVFDKVPLETEVTESPSVRSLERPDYGKITAEQSDVLAAINEALINVRRQRYEARDDPEESAKLVKRYTKLKEERKILIQEINTGKVETPPVAEKAPDVESYEDAGILHEKMEYLRSFRWDERVSQEVDDLLYDIKGVEDLIRSNEQAKKMPSDLVKPEVYEKNLKELREERSLLENKADELIEKCKVLETDSDTEAEILTPDVKTHLGILPNPETEYLKPDVATHVEFAGEPERSTDVDMSAILQDQLLLVHAAMKELRGKEDKKEEMAGLYKREREIKQSMLNLYRLEQKNRVTQEQDESVQEQSADRDFKAATERAGKTERDYTKLKKAGAIAGVGLAGTALVGAGLFAKAYYWVRWKGPLKLLEGLMKFTGDPGGTFTKAFNKFESLDPYKAAKEALQNKDAKKEK